MLPVKVYYCGSPASWGYKSYSQCAYLKILNRNFSVDLTKSENADFFFVNETLESRKDFYKNFRKDAVSILISGEAFAPDFNLYDYALGFDPLSYADRYLRYEPGFRFKKYLEISPGGNLNFESRKFCEFIYSNFLANPKRDDLKSIIGQISNIDSHGKHLNNVKSEIDELTKKYGWEKAKVEIQSNYRFSIAAENAFHLGYTSEKVFTSISANSIPIYWGNPLIHNDVNPSRIINVHAFASSDDLVKRVHDVNADSDLFYEIVSQPIFTPNQIERMNSYEDRLEEFILNIFSTPSPLRKGNGTFNYVYQEIIFGGFKFGKIIRLIKEARKMNLLYVRLKNKVRNKIVRFLSR